MTREHSKERSSVKEERLKKFMAAKMSETDLRTAYTLSRVGGWGGGGAGREHNFRLEKQLSDSSEITGQQRA